MKRHHLLIIIVTGVLVVLGVLLVVGILNGGDAGEGDDLDQPTSGLGAAATAAVRA